jgi:hypothetical protein
LITRRVLERFLQGHAKAAIVLAGLSCSLAVASPLGVATGFPPSGPSIATLCDGLPGYADRRLSRGMIPTAPSDIPRPAKGIPVRDPVFGTCVVRATEHDADPPKGFARNDYSRRQAFNADSTRFLIVASDGAWHLYDAATLRHIEVLADLGGDAEPQWHTSDPDILYYLPRNGVGMTLKEFNTRSRRSRVVGDFGSRIRKVWPTAESAWTRSEGSPSADMRYWAFQVDNAAWEGLGMFVYDMQTDVILATYDFASHGKPRPDHLSMSPSGRYVVVSWDGGPVVLDRNLTHPRNLARRGEHSDMALNAAGDDVYVSVDYESHGGPVYMVNLRTGERTDLFDSYIGGTATAMHFSGKGYRRPGWVVISTYADYMGEGRLRRLFSSDGFKWLHRKVMAIELRANPTIVNLAFHHSKYDEYWTEPQASTNQEMTRILFNSNWGTASKTDVDAYMIVLPPHATGTGF